MCQYNSRCKVQRHRPGTVCPLSGAGRAWMPAPAPQQPRPVMSRPRSVTPTGPSRFGSSAGAGGVSLVDLLALLVVTKAWDRFYETGGVWAVAVACLLLLLPFVVATWLAYRCTAWNKTVEGRCAKPRPGPFRRCELSAHSHAAQLATAPEVAAAASFLGGILGLWLFFTGR